MTSSEWAWVDGLFERGYEKAPFWPNRTRNVMNLICNLCNVRLTETFGFLTERNVPLVFPVNSHHPVEARSQKKREIERVSTSIKRSLI